MECAWLAGLLPVINGSVESMLRPYLGLDGKIFTVARSLMQVPHQKPAASGCDNDADVRDAEVQPFSLAPLPVGAPAAAVPGGEDAVALIICHGMGQQVRHETLAEAADNLHCGRRLGNAGGIPVRYVRFTNADHPEKRDRLLPRAEIQVLVPAAAAPQQPAQNEFRQAVHVYEVYWAPLTEGRIGLTEVVRFLAAAGVRGLLYSFGGFTRWLFGQQVQLAVDRFTFFRLFGLLLLILSLVLLNAVMTLVLGEQVLQTDAVRHATPEFVNRLTEHLTWVLVAGVVLAEGVKACNSCQRQSPEQPFAVAWVVGLLFVVWALLLFVAVRTGADYFVMHRAGPAFAPPAAVPAVPWRAVLTWRNGWVGVVWGCSVLVSWWCRGFLVQYLGDVAIYVDAYKVDKYFAIRTRIRRVAQDTLEAVYGARVGADRFRYQRVVVTGHSLGSAVAYDALNALLVADQSAGGGDLRVADRTQALVTFGSPLDKTAFLFHAQPRKTAAYTALDSSRQPLLWDKAVRQAVQWVNLYSGADIVSGPLDYYHAALCPQPVLNLPDPDAFTPVYAHVQYWNGPKLSRVLRLALGGRPAP